MIPICLHTANSLTLAVNHLIPSLLIPIQDESGGTPPAGGGGGLFGGNMLVPMAVIFGIFYFLMILPEKKKQKARVAMLGSLSKGNRVITTGGLYAKVMQVQEDIVTLEVADGVRVRYSVGSVQQVLEDENASD